MRRFEDSTFVFISTNATHEPGGVEERWLPVMRALAAKGAGVRFLAVMGSPMGEWARTEAGIEVDPYILDKWNVIRSRSRLRKYLKRYVPVCAHSTGIEADLLLRWAARKVPVVRVAHTLTGTPQGTRRRGPVDALMRRFDEFGISSADAIVVDDAEREAELMARNMPATRVILAPSDSAHAEVALQRHLDLYRRFLAERGVAG